MPESISEKQNYLSLCRRLQDEEATTRFAANLAAQLRPPAVLALRGELGAGKTVLSRALIRMLAGHASLEVPSPTFTLLQIYDAARGFPVHHLDLYRLQDAEEIYDLGWDDLLQNGVTLVEWPERLGALLPRRRLEIIMKTVPGDEAARDIELRAFGMELPCLPDKAFVLAAGLGTRLKPLTETTPKPLAEVAGHTLLERTIDALGAVGVSDITLNTHHLAEKIDAFVKAYQGSPRLRISHEPALLDTGGGIMKALGDFDSKSPFYVLSGDGLWSEGPGFSALQRLAAAWDDRRMDILMLLHPLQNMTVTKGTGDYHLAEDGRATRAHDRKGPYVFTSIRLHHPRIFEGAPEGPFSYLDLMDRAERQGRLFGIVHAGDWHHISTMQDLEAVRALYGPVQKQTQKA